MNEAVESCKEAFLKWSKTTILQRQQIMFRYQDLIKKNMVCLVFFFVLVKENLTVCREESQRIFQKNKVKPLLMPKVQLYVVYKWLNHVVQLHFYKPVKQCIVLQKIWIFIVFVYH